MKLWLLTQETNNDYDTYDAVVVAAHTEESAKLIHPNEYPPKEWADVGPLDRPYGAWTSKGNVKCKLIGEAVSGTRSGVICASFNAG